MDAAGPVVRETTNRSLTEEGAVLCAVAVTPTRVLIVVNSIYPHALEHAELHAAPGEPGVWMCTPECNGE